MVKLITVIILLNFSGSFLPQEQDSCSNCSNQVSVDTDEKDVATPPIQLTGVF